MMENLSIKLKILLGFLLAGLLPIIFISLSSINTAEYSLEHEQSNKLDAVMKIKKSMIETFFNERLGDVRVLANNPFVKEAYKQFENVYTSNGSLRGNGNYSFDASDEYREVHRSLHPSLKYYMDQYGYFDLFLISPDKGDIVYTVFKEGDFATKVNSTESSLSYVWERSVKYKEDAISDMEPYAPSGGIPALFVSAPIVENGAVIGVVALQVSNDAINKLMQMNDGLGKTGRTYLVEKHGSSTTLINDRRDGKRNGDSIASDEINRAVNGEMGVNISEKVGKIIAYAPVKIRDLKWGIIAEIDMEEVDQPIVEIRNSILLYSFILLVLVIISAYLLSNQINKTIIRIQNFFEQLSDNVYRGKFSEEVEIDNVGVDFKPLVESGDSVVKAFVNTLDNMPIPFMTMDNNLNLQYMNNLAKQVGGVDNYNNKTCHSVMRADDCKNGRCAINRCMSSGKIEESETYANPTNGKEYEVKYYGNPLKDRDGNVVGAIEILLDQTAEVLAKRKEVKVKEYQNNEVGKLNFVLEEVSNGDLTTSYNPETGSEDTEASFDTFSNISVILNKVILTLNNIMREVYNSSEQVSQATGQVASASQSLSSGTTEQAASIEEISSSLQEVMSQVKQTSSNSGEAKKLSNDSLNITVEGNKKMELLVEAMNEIKNSSSEISKIIKTIDEIAFQTNLLALNAAVEAARAGKHGKGFAVVAEEVRNLAARSSKAAKETSDLIEDSIRKVTAGGEFVDDTSNSLKNIENSFVKLNSLVDEVAEASQEQSLRVTEVNTGVDQINSVTQQNAANAEETAAAAEEMQSQAVTLAGIIKRFKTDDSSNTHLISMDDEIYLEEDRRLLN